MSFNDDTVNKQKAYGVYVPILLQKMADSASSTQCINNW